MFISISLLERLFDAHNQAFVVRSIQRQRHIKELSAHRLLIADQRRAVARDILAGKVDPVAALPLLGVDASRRVSMRMLKPRTTTRNACWL